MNAGKWIVIVFILFAGFIGTLVTICVREDISLVSKDYYKEELAYQEQIKRMKNTAELTVKPQVTATQASLRVVFDASHSVTQGQLNLFCPSDASMDRKFTLNSNKREFSWPLTGIKPGMYRVKLHWSMNSKDYYQEEIVNL
ncbi:MAG: FixH family protein [Cyclobacteriaceae bacterium]